MKTAAQISPLFDPKVRKVSNQSKLDAGGRPICVYCEKRLRWNVGYGYEGQGIFCSMKCAATWGNIKAAFGDDE